jgi:uncharacterized protein (DUF58 family)
MLCAVIPAEAGIHADLGKVKLDPRLRGDDNQTVTTHGVYTSLPDLIRLQWVARGFNLQPRQPLRSVLAGRHAARIRGRGLDFDELRAYLPGDDVRAIDWKVTARTGKPHTRIYTDERERRVLLVVDQRLAMFFGTRVQLKSVTAAELAALLAWHVVGAGDRVGAVVFDDALTVEVEPHRSRVSVLRVLETLVERNCALGLDRGIVGDPSRINAVLEGVARSATHDCLIFVASDFHGADADTQRIVKRLARHNDVVAALIHDPSAITLPVVDRAVVSDGHLQIEIDLASARKREVVETMMQERLRQVRRLEDELGVPVLPIDTSGDVAGQLRRVLGFRPMVQKR